MHKIIKTIIFVQILMLPLYSQNVYLRGTILDSLNNKPIKNSKISIDGFKNERYSNEEGKFSIYMRNTKSIKINISCSGYEELNDLIISGNDTINKIYFLKKIKDKIKIYNLGSVEINTRREIDLQMMSVPSFSLSAKTLNEVPVFIESDVFQAIQVLPSISRVSDWSGKLSIRGGSSYQNQVLFDDIPVFNSFHYGGLVGIFNSDIIENVEIFPSCYPPEFGGATSGIMKIISKEKYAEKREIKGSLGLLLSRISITNKLGDGFLTFAGRRANLDIFGSLYSGNSITENFYDIYGKYKYIVDSNNLISSSIFYSKDNIANMFESVNNDIYFGEYISPYWYNFIYSLKLEHYFKSNQYLSLLIYSSNYGIESKLNWREILPSSANSHVDIKNHLTQEGIKLKYNTSYDDLKINSGLEYYIFTMSYFWDAKAENYLGIVKPPYKVFMDYAPSYFKYNDRESNCSFFTYFNYRLINDINIGAGVRFECPTWIKSVIVNPYLNLIYKPAQEININLKYSKNYQGFICYDDRNSEFIYNAFSLPFFTDKNNYPISDHYSINTEMENIIDGMDVNIELYFIKKNTIPYILTSEERYISNYNENINGIDCFLKYSDNRLNGSIGYTFGKIIRKEDNISFPGNYDQRHVLKIFMNYKISNRFNLSVEYYYSSGFPYSMPTGIMYGANFDEIHTPSTMLNFEMGNRLPFIASGIYKFKNNKRTPVYSRFDISAIYEFAMWGGRFSSFLSLINVFDQENLSLTDIDMANIPPMEKYFKGLPIVPNLGVNFEF
jgi:hypothetical protein